MFPWFPQDSIREGARGTRLLDKLLQAHISNSVEFRFCDILKVFLSEQICVSFLLGGGGGVGGMERDVFFMVTVHLLTHRSLHRNHTHAVTLQINFTAYIQQRATRGSFLSSVNHKYSFSLAIVA